MLKISQKTKPSKAAVIVPLQCKLHQLYDTRVATISHMSGYPSAIHVIGRLQRQIDLSSFDALLQSLLKVRDLVRVTADVIDSMEGVKVDKFQINRTEIAAYVENITAHLQTFKAGPDDVDLISHLITSFEANTGAWVLLGATPADDLHLKFKRLYDEVLRKSEDMELSVYAPHKDAIERLGNLPQFAQKIKTSKKHGLEDKTDTAEDLRSAATIYRLAAVKIIDHVYQLMMDKDVWYSFVSTRAKAEIASNLERAKSLKVFSLYLQSLLSYNQFFMLETFMKGYDLVQNWITHFPPLEASTIQKLENVVRPHDILNAKHDVSQILNSFTDSNDHDLSSDLIVFPEELLSAFGISKAVRLINDATVAFAINSDFKDAGDLDDKKYLPLLAGIATSEFNVTHDLSKVILLGKMVSGEVDKALADLVPALVRGASKMTIETLKGLSLSAKLPFLIPHALQWHITKGVSKGIENGMLTMDSASPSFTWAYHDHIRKNFRMKMATDDQIVKSYKLFHDKQIVDRDKAAKMRSLFGYEWRSLVPDFWQNGNTIYTEAMLKSDPHVVRALIETLSGRNFEIAIRELGVSHLRAMWATYLSSFALLYIDDATVDKFAPNKGDALRQPLLIEGHGKPYGTSYSALASKQPPVTGASDFIVLAEGIYLRMLTLIPVVSDDLQIDPHFFLEHPNMYFNSNSVSMPVTQWVVDDSLLNLCLFPVSQVPCVPGTMFTNKYAYLTMELFMNMDIYFKPAVSDKAREVIPIGLTVKDWPYDRHTYFIEYKTFGSYGADRSNIELDVEQELVADAVKKIEATIVKDQKEVSDVVEGSGNAINQALKQVEKEVKDGQSKHMPLGDDEKPASIDSTK